MSGIEIRNFLQPDELVTFEHGTASLVTVGPLTLGREVLEPGWRWSVHVRPIAGTDRCEFHHVSVLVSGRLAVESRDGELREIAPGEVYDLAPGHDAWVVGDEPAVSIDFQGIAGWAKAPEPGERVLTTMLFTDIVGSTRVAEQLGDGPWRQLLATHHEDVRGLLELHHGREVKTTGDGFLAVFDGPARAITCALAITQSAHRLGIEVRSGLHTGEVELAEGDLRGVAVHLAARVMDAAGPGQVFTSGTTRELASGAGVAFVDRGMHELKGISGPRQIFEARGGA